MNKSLHILADLYNCSGEGNYLSNAKLVQKKILEMVRRSGFKIVHYNFHKFRPGTNATEGGITGVIVVSESHLAFHTWPEKNYINLDVFFCNYSRDNSMKAKRIFEEFSEIYRPQKIRKKEVWRD